MVHTGEENHRCFAQYGKIGKKYYYNCEDKEAKQKAIRKANTQAPSIKKFIRNYWNMKENFKRG